MSNTHQLSPDILLKQGMQLDQTGQHDAAAVIYRQILEQQPDHAFALYLLGAIALRSGKLDTAVEMIGSAILNNSKESVFHLSLGLALQKRGDLNDALNAYDIALCLAPQNPFATFRRAVVLMMLQRESEAVAGFKRVFGIDPNFSAIALSQARTFIDIGELETAEKLLMVILQFNSRMQDAYVLLGHVFLVRERYSEAQQVFAHLFHMERGTGWNGAPFIPRSSATSPNTDTVKASTFFFKNMIGHIDYLIERGKLHTSFTCLAGIYWDLLEESVDAVDSFGFISLTPEQSVRVRKEFPSALYYADSEPISGPAINPALDVAKIQQDYLDSPWRMTWFDDFLTPDALNSLRKFCLESTIFFRQSHNTFVASYLAEGLNCSVLYMIVSELKARFPDVLGPLSLQNIWCYRQAPEGDGVLPHSDRAAVTFNFWITADDANLDKEHGGMVLYDKEQPLGWDWYNTNIEKDNPAVLNRIMAYLEDASTTIIPYGENRAVMFYSNMFHSSDKFHFKPGYENSRMNVTMLFGQHATQIETK